MRGVDSLSTDLCVVDRPAILASLPARRSGCPTDFEHCEVVGDGTCRCLSPLPLAGPAPSHVVFVSQASRPRPLLREALQKPTTTVPSLLARTSRLGTLLRGEG